MGLQVALTSASAPARITIGGVFDYGMNKEFRDALKLVEGSQRCVVDLGEATYVDSSALGMLLLLKEQVDEVVIENCGGYPRRVFDLAGFDVIFDLD